jgi:hypothetical protein
LSLLIHGDVEGMLGVVADMPVVAPAHPRHFRGHWSILNIALDKARKALGVPPSHSVPPGVHWDAGSHHIVPACSTDGETM